MDDKEIGDAPPPQILPTGLREMKRSDIVVKLSNPEEPGQTGSATSVRRQFTVELDSKRILEAEEKKEADVRKLMALTRKNGADYAVSIIVRAYRNPDGAAKVIGVSVSRFKSRDDNEVMETLAHTGLKRFPYHPYIVAAYSKRLTEWHGASMAELFLDDALAHNPHPGIFKAAAVLAKKQKNFSKADEYYRKSYQGWIKILDYEPDNMEALDSIAELSVKYGDPQITADFLWDKFLRNPSDLTPLNGVMEIAGLKGKPVQFYRMVRDKMPNNEVLEGALAKSYMVVNKPNKALKLFKKLCESNPHNISAFFDYIIALKALKKSDDVISLLKEHFDHPHNRSSNPEKSKTLLLLFIGTLFNTQQWDETIRHAQQYDRLYPPNGDIQTCVALAYLHKGERLANVESLLIKILGDRPTNSGIRCKCAAIMVKQANLDGAVRIIKEGLSLEFKIDLFDMLKKLAEYNIDRENYSFLLELSHRSGRLDDNQYNILKLRTPLEHQIDNLCKFIASQNLKYSEKWDACRAMNTVLGDNLTEQLMSTQIVKSTDLLVKAIDAHYRDEPDKFNAFLLDIRNAKSGLPDGNPLLTYRLTGIYKDPLDLVTDPAFDQYLADNPIPLQTHSGILFSSEYRRRPINTDAVNATARPHRE